MCPSGIINITKTSDSSPAFITQLPGSKHIALSPDGYVYHLEKKCLEKVAPEHVVNNAEAIPADSITMHSKANLKKEYTKKCSICLEEDSVWLFMMPCTHMMCSGCYDIWKYKSTKCPVCNCLNYGLNLSFEAINNKPPKKLRLASQHVEKKHKLIVPVLTRIASAGCTQNSLSQPINFNPINNYNHMVSLSSYEELRACALGATINNPNPSTTIVPISSASELSDFSNVIKGNGKVFITATTQQSITFNDLNCIIYQKNENEVYDLKHNNKSFLNFSNKSCYLPWIKHSGDTILEGSNLESDNTNDRYSKLLHGIYIDLPEGHEIEVHFINENIEGSSINSTVSNDSMHSAFTHLKDTVINNIGHRNPKYIMFFAQVTWQEANTLESLSPNIAPSCGFIMNRRIYACDWSDPTNMTSWMCAMIYD
tara:strand:+ start:897 stop:2174 length:1278 start_codon:yes stop_codon:yes gene_type:complete